MRFSFYYLFFIALLFCAKSAQSQLDQQRGFFYYQQSLRKSIPFRQAVNDGLKALNFASENQNDSLMTLAYIQLGILYWNDGEFDKALDHLQKGQKLSTKRGEIFKIAQCLHYKGLVHYYRCQFDSALIRYDLAEQLFEQLKVDSALAKLKSHKGLIYSATGQYKLAIQNMLESFKLQESSPGYRDMTIALQFSSPTDEILYYKSKLDKDRESLQFLKDKMDKEKLAFTFLNLGKDFYYLKQYKEAISCFLRSTKLYREIGQLPFTGELAAAYVGAGNYDSAEYWYKSRLADVRTKGTQINLSAIYMDMGILYRKQKNWKESLKYYGLSFELSRALGLQRSVAASGRGKAVVLLELHRELEALNEIENSLSIARRINSIRDIQEFLDIKATILHRLHRDREAVVVLQQSRILSDSISNGESQLQVARLQIEYETEKKNRDLLELQFQNKLKETKIKSGSLQIALAFFLLSIIAMAGGFYYFRYRQKKKSSELLIKQKQVIEVQNRSLQSQNKEKEILLSEIHHRVKNNLQVISSLINLKSQQVSAETNEALQQLNGRIFSMGLIHEKLYQKDNIRIIRLDTYLAELGRYLLGSFNWTDHPIHFELDCDPVDIDVEKALSCGLIFNELMTNSFKYAFSESQKDNRISLSIKKKSGLIELRIEDNGLKETTKSEEGRSSFGLRFVDQLVSSKLGGAWSQWHDKGFHVCIKLPIHA